MKHTVWRCFLIFVLVATISGCMFSRLEGDLEKMQNVSHVFAGTISVKGSESNEIGRAHV